MAVTGQTAAASYNLPRDQTVQRWFGRVLLHLQHQALQARGRAAPLDQRHGQRKLELAPSVVISAIELALLSMLTCCNRANRRHSFYLRMCEGNGNPVSDQAQATCSITTCEPVKSALSYSILLRSLLVLGGIRLNLQLLRGATTAFPQKTFLQLTWKVYSEASRL